VNKKIARKSVAGLPGEKHLKTHVQPNGIFGFIRLLTCVKTPQFAFKARDIPNMEHNNE
jgi:hypothetical protein